MTRPFFITTSWDDGHRLDLRVADLLDRYGLTGTFYIAREYIQPRMSDDEIAALAARHEIGAHTLTHPILTKLSPEKAKSEIEEPRFWLETITGKAVSAFCYPRGAYHAVTRDLAMQAGYLTARTVEAYQIEAGSDPFTLPTTIQVYPFPMRPVKHPRARFEPLRRAWPHFWRLNLPLKALFGWESLALALLKRAAEAGGVWHLWGHSWEVEKYGMWDSLERVLKIASQLESARPVTNSELIRQVGRS